MVFFLFFITEIVFFANSKKRRRHINPLLNNMVLFSAAHADALKSHPFHVKRVSNQSCSTVIHTRLPAYIGKQNTIVCSCQMYFSVISVIPVTHIRSASTRHERQLTFTPAFTALRKAAPNSGCVRSFG